jgi:hypothetical protein
MGAGGASLASEQLWIVVVLEDGVCYFEVPDYLG